MLTGEYQHTLDPKNRIFVPAKHREILGETIVISCSFREKCLKMYSLEGWGAYIAPLEKQDARLRERVFRFLHRTAVEATPDKQGRIVLPESLIAYAGVDKDLVVIGCGDHDEIWNADLYRSTVVNDDVDEIRRQMEFCGL